MPERHHYTIHVNGLSITTMARDAYEALEMYGFDEDDVSWVKEDGRVIIPSQGSVDRSAQLALSLVML